MSDRGRTDPPAAGSGGPPHAKQPPPTRVAPGPLPTGDAADAVRALLLEEVTGMIELESAGAARPPATAAELAESERRAPAFARSVAQAWEMAQMRRRAQAAFAQRPAPDFPGFGALLDLALGRDEAALGEIAARLGLHPIALQYLRADKCLATDVRPDAVVRLANALDLDEATFLVLVARDLEARPDARLESDPPWPVDGSAPERRAALDRVLAPLREAWREADALVPRRY